MKFTKALILALSIVAVCLFVANIAHADQWNKKTKVTFSQPVEIPGKVAQILPAGTYIFKLVDSQSNRNIVRIFNEDETQVFATILAIPNYRLGPTDETVLTFKERASGTPQAIRAWFYPGETFGHEFVYSKARATELAKVTNEPVLETTTDLFNAPMDVLKTAPIETVEPSGEIIQQAKVVEPPAAAAPTATIEPVLPHTASPLPILALVGLLSFGGIFLISIIRKRVA